MPEFELWLADETATVAFGQRLGQALATVAGACVFLEGDLGAGKTTLTRGVLYSFGHSGAVKSPTYTLVEVYELSRPVCHFDLYRLGDPEELEYMGIRDYFADKSVCLVEWPSRGRGFLPAPDVTAILIVQAGGRLVKLEAGTEKGCAILAALAH
ncbi:MAG TPA: tRNA (adenosine(37)-N6)-threonylcarbamoyltransferase complex ATPase subunit type 1 TsaE [Cellvibrionaceae bacterium]